MPTLTNQTIQSDEILTKILANQSRIPNDKQIEAITAPLNRDVRVLAPAGSGKSTLLEYRVAYLIENGIDPQNIVITTFSKSMANEAAKRQVAMNPNLNPDYISTINGICNRILTVWDVNLPTYGWSNWGQWNWKLEALINKLIEKYWYDDNDIPNAKETYEKINLSKAHCISPDDCVQFYTKLMPSNHAKYLCKIRQEFDRINAREKMLTFADQLYFVERGLKSGQLDHWKNKWEYALIDEAQDTNFSALNIMLQLGKYSMLVGDTDQSLYGFNLARPEVLLSDYRPDIITVMLEKNYRSTPEIIKSSSDLIAHNYSKLNGPYDQKFMKSVTATSNPGREVTYTLYETVEDEAFEVASTIKELIELEDYKPDAFFVGARTKAQLSYIENELVMAQIPFINITGGSVWSNKHVKELIGYLKLAFDHNDNDAFKLIYNIASAEKTHYQTGKYQNYRGLGNEFLNVCQNSYLNVDSAVRHRKHWYYGVKDLKEFMARVEYSLSHSSDMGEVLEFIRNNCYDKWLKSKDVDGDTDESIMEILDSIVSIASKYSDPKEFIDYVNNMTELSENSKDWTGNVVLSTYHKLKGLERLVMIGVGWCEGYDKNGLRTGLLPHKFSLQPVPQFGVFPPSKGNEIYEERCIGYVAVSRGIERVILTGCRIYRDWIMGPSRFVKEMGLVKE